MKKKAYVQINLHGGQSYIQPPEKLVDALYGELDDLLNGSGAAVTITFGRVDMTPREYEKLPEFAGH